MVGQQFIEKVKSAFMGRKRANEVIAWVNLPWGVTMPWPPTEWGVPVIRASKTAITIDLSQLKTAELIACDSEGNQHTFVVIGYEKITPP